MTDKVSPFGNKKLVTAHEIAACLGCSSKHVRRLAALGKIPKFVKIGRLCRWNRESIEKWLADKLAAVGEGAITND